MSLSTASNWPLETASSASRPVRAEVTRNPLRVSPVSSISRMERSSSATRMWGCRDIPGFQDAAEVKELTPVYYARPLEGHSVCRTSGVSESPRALGSALLSVVIVGTGAPLGREGAPKHAGGATVEVTVARDGAHVRLHTDRKSTRLNSS